jgi:uncharacterized protein (TIGR03083 family)
VTGVRLTYLKAADTAIGLVSDPKIEESWDLSSALREWRVGGLAGHLARAVSTVEQYLDADPAPAGEQIGPGAYYARVIDTNDIESELHRAIRKRGDEMAVRGCSGLVTLMQETVDRLRRRLDSEPGDRSVAVLQGMVLSLDDYLRTRLVEIVVHSDDLAVSLGVTPPVFSPRTYRIVTDVLIDTARERYGDLAIVRALARRERDGVEALRVF